MLMNESAESGVFCCIAPLRWIFSQWLMGSVKPKTWNKSPWDLMEKTHRRLTIARTKAFVTKLLPEFQMLVCVRIGFHV